MSARRATRALIKSCDRQAAYFWKGPKIKILTITVEASARIVPSRVGEVKGDLSVFFTTRVKCRLTAAQALLDNILVITMFTTNQICKFKQYVFVQSMYI